MRGDLFDGSLRCWRWFAAGCGAAPNVPGRWFLAGGYVDMRWMIRGWSGEEMSSLAELGIQAVELLNGCGEGEELSPLGAALITLAVTVSVTSLRADRLPEVIDTAGKAGASAAQIQEIVSLVSGLGVHSLMVSAALILDRFEVAPSFDEARQKLWLKHVADNPYWAGFEAELPGFLPALLHLSPESFQGFFDFCAIAWVTRHVDAVTKELAAMACDAAPQHRFGPGFRLHLKNAIKLGAGRKAILETLRIAAAAPEHIGIA